MAGVLNSFSRRFSTSAKKVEDSDRIKPPTESLTEFIRRVNPNYRIYRFTEILIEALEKVYIGQITWLFINLPPRFGKTSLLEMFSAWVMAQEPSIHIGYCSYNKEIASDPCKNAREYYLAAGHELNPAQAAKINWETLHKGKMWAAGFGGTVRGRGYHIGIIDDAHKQSDELYSEAQVRKWRSFWDKTWLNRGMVHSKRPVARIVIGQRLGEGDVFGYILSKPDADKWSGIVLDLQRDTTQPYPYPEKVLPNIVTDWREDGELLEPLICNEEFMATVGEEGDDERDAQYQQRPKRETGVIFDVSKFQVVTSEMVPKLICKVGGVDLAITSKQTSDWSVAIALGLGVDGRYYFFRPWRDKKESPHLRREIPIYLRNEGVYMVGVDATAYQTSFVQDLRADPTMAGIAVLELNKGLDRSDKVLLARSWSYLVEAGLVCLVDDGSGWTLEFMKELKNFPRSTYHDDQVDASGYAFKVMRLLSSGHAEGTASAA